LKKILSSGKEGEHMNDSQQTKVYQTLTAMQIAYESIEHPAVYTIEEMEKLDLPDANAIVKNLFIRDDKKRHYDLVVLQKDKRVNLKELRTKLASRPLTFASETDLMDKLGLLKGAVTPLGIINDSEHQVNVILDEAIMSFERIGIHPNDNTATVLMAPSALVKYIEALGNPLSYIDIV
jgi:Ala-tRNA(Pro) deacylase